MDIQVSSNFKKMTSKAVFAIALFIVVYIFLLISAIVLTILCVAGGFALIVAKPMVITIGLGIGLASLGFFVLIFLFKFLFKQHKIDRSHLLEISQSQEPKLFKLIEEIVNEVKTDFPKKIYLSGDVNACVFYDSSFWSMIFPIRKNLQIGIGLVNTISKQEFKAILAHEFGHFSQRSMKVGSYVYNVNQVIYNLLYDNESFDIMIQKWANISGYFSIFVILAVKIIESIQWILRKMYDFVNLSYMALSREMEFHADEVAANVAGYLPLKESLLRMDLSDHSFNSVLNFYNNKIADNLKSQNIYKEQKFVMEFLASYNNIPFKNNLPLVSELDLSRYNKSKLNIKDQWASHPSIEDRISALEKLDIQKENNNFEPASLLFSNTEKTEEQITHQLFSNIEYKETAEFLDAEKFKSEFIESFHKNSFPKAYNGYYDDKNPIKFDIDAIIKSENTKNIETLFSKENVDLVYDYIALENDRNILNGIVSKAFKVKTFDYDGQKFNSKDASKLIKKLDVEIKSLNEKILNNDIEIFSFFCFQALEKGTEGDLKIMYRNFFNEEIEFETKVLLYNKFVESTNFISMVTFLFSCKNDNKVENVERAFYYWKGNSLGQENLGQIKKLNLNKLYVKLFEVDYSEARGNFPFEKNRPRYYDFKELDSLEVVPTIYIKNGIFQYNDEKSLDKLADNIVFLINKYSIKVDYSDRKEQVFNYNEIQIDCDWTKSTKDKYFYLLKKIKELI
jgi:Zn-dependent protease with chaperone function